jgi:hypothetical protein
MLGLATWLTLLYLSWFLTIPQSAGMWSQYESFYRVSALFTIPLAGLGTLNLWRWARQPRRLHLLGIASTLGLLAGACGIEVYGTVQRQSEQLRIGRALRVDPALLPYSGSFPAYYLVSELDDGRHTRADVQALVPLSRAVMPCGTRSEALFFLSDSYSDAEVLLVGYDDAGIIRRTAAVTDNSRNSLDVECRRTSTSHFRYLATISPPLDLHQTWGSSAAAVGYQPWFQQAP